MNILYDSLWALYNDYSNVKGVMIISHSDWKKEIERICIQNQIGKDKQISGEGK